jgi:hypothetical protein
MNVAVAGFIPGGVATARSSEDDSLVMDDTKTPGGPAQ